MLLLTEYNEEVAKIGMRLTDFVVYFSPITKKAEFVNLLDRLNKLNTIIINKLKENSIAYKNNSGKALTDDEARNVDKLSAKIYQLLSIIRNIVEKIDDIEKQNQEDEKTKEEVLQESKKELEKQNKDTNYIS